MPGPNKTYEEVNVDEADVSDTSTDPTGNGEIRRNGSDLKAYSGGSVRNLSNIGGGDDPFSYDPGMTNWEDALSDEEIARIALQTGETLVVERIEFRQKGGGSSANASIDVRDVTAGSTIGSQTLGGTTKDAGSSGTANTVIIRLNNSTGGAIDAAPRVQGYITEA